MRRRHAQPAETAEFSFTLPRRHLDLLKELADDHGWSAGEVIRRGVVLFFQANINITDSRYSLIANPDAERNDNGHDQ